MESGFAAENIFITIDIINNERSRLSKIVLLLI